MPPATHPPRQSPGANGPARLPLSGGANLHRVYPIRPTTAERRMVDVETAARETFGCRDLDGPPRIVRIEPAINWRAVLVTVAIVYVLLVGALAVTP